MSAVLPPAARTRTDAAVGRHRPAGTAAQHHPAEAAARHHPAGTAAQHRPAGTVVRHRARQPFGAPALGLRQYSAATVAVVAAVALLLGQADGGSTRAQPPADVAGDVALANSGDRTEPPGANQGAARPGERAPVAAPEQGAAPAVPDAGAPAGPSGAVGAAPPPVVPPAPGQPTGPTTGPDAPTPTTRPDVGPAGSLRLTGSTAVALTFDDGPDPVHTPRLLDLLRQHGVTAMFCVVGARARAHPELIRRIVDEGHTLCNHSWRHDLGLGARPVELIRLDLRATSAAIHAAAPDAEIRHFRAPGGNFTPLLTDVARQQGMTSLYWDVDPRDWEHDPTATPQAHVERIVATVRQETRAGSIVLSHDFRQPETITAYETLIPWLKERYTLTAM